MGFDLIQRVSYIQLTKLPVYILSGHNTGVLKGPMPNNGNPRATEIHFENVR